MDLPAKGSVKEGLEVYDAIRAFAEAWTLSEAAADQLIEAFDDLLPELFQNEDVDPYKED